MADRPTPRQAPASTRSAPPPLSTADVDYLPSLRITLAKLAELRKANLTAHDEALQAEWQAAQSESAAAMRKQSERAQQRAAAQQAAMDTELQQAQQASTELLQRQLGELDANLSKTREQLEAQRNEVISLKRRRRDDRVLMSETIAAATVAGLEKELSHTRRTLEQLEQQRGELRAACDQTMARYGVEVEEPEASVGEDTPAVNLERAGDSVVDLQDLPLPRWMFGSGYWVVASLLVATAGGLSVAAPLLGLEWGWSLQARLLAVTLPLVTVTLLMGAHLRRVARRQAGAAASKAYFDLAAASASIVRADAAANERFAHAKSEALDLQQTEIREARERFDHSVTELRGRNDDALARLQSEYHEKKARFEGEHAQRLADAQSRVSAKTDQAQAAASAVMRSAEEKHQAKATRADSQFQQARSELASRWREHADRLSDLVAQARQLHLPRFDLHGETNPEWSTTTQLVQQIPIGTLRLRRNDLPDGLAAHTQTLFDNEEQLSLPTVLTLPHAGSLLVETGAGGHAASIDLLRSVVVRILTTLPPGQAHFTILDPVGLGENFAGLMHLVDYEQALLGGRIWTEAEHIEQRLHDLTEHIETVIQKYLRNEFDSIAAYNSQAGELAEPYRFLVIADFPAGFSESAFEALSSIARSGPRCGVFVLAMNDLRRAANSLSLDDLRERSVHLVHGDLGFQLAGHSQPHTLDVERSPSERRLTDLMHAVGRGAQDALRVQVPYESIEPAPDAYWSRTSEHELRAPLGRTGAVRMQEFRLGRGIAQHVLLAGKTGSGKSTLLHVLITNLAQWYSPDELAFYLIDFKKGVEFKTYATQGLPHARAIAIESDREFGVSVLQKIDAEMQRRGELFRDAEVQDLAGYRSATGKKLPRTMLIVDEFQVFFGEDDRLSQEAGILLDRLVRQGRAFGIHVVLGSQTLASSVTLPRSTFGQMPVRIALQCSEADAQLIMDDTNTAARSLTRPGAALYNDAGGLIEGNSPFQVAWLTDEQRALRVRRLREQAEVAQLDLPRPAIFEGNAPAHLHDNPLLLRALDDRDPKQPLRVWLGEPVAIKPPTGFELRRQPGTHLLILGQREDAAVNVLSAGVLGLAAQRPAEQLRFILLDGTPEEDRASSGLQRLRSVVPHEMDDTSYHDVATQVNRVAEEVAARLSGGPQDQTWVLVIHGLQRYRILRRREDDFSFSRDEDAPPAPDKQLATILREGPAVGVHVLTWCDTFANLERTLDRSAIGEFDNRMLFQISAADSVNLIDTPEANRLGFHRALLFSEERGVMEKLRPYSALDAEWLGGLDLR